MFGIYSRIAAVIAIGVFLAGIYWRGHTQGYKARDLIAQAEQAQHVAEALQASEQARKVEQELNRKVRNVQDAYRVARANTDNLAAASAVGMRELQTILAAPAVASSGAAGSSGNNGTGGLERELLGNCAQALTELGKTADRLENKVVGLQEYIKAIGENP